MKEQVSDILNVLHDLTAEMRLMRETSNRQGGDEQWDEHWENNMGTLGGQASSLPPNNISNMNDEDFEDLGRLEASPPSVHSSVLPVFIPPPVGWMFRASIASLPSSREKAHSIKLS